MHGERDMLVRYVFPELRARCRAHCLHVQEVDLRWGIAQEATVSQSSLELCLSEVSRCHLFVGILGERYGATVSPDNLPEGSHFYWLREYDRGASVTELEIYAACLAAPKTVQGRAFFYIRNSDFERDIPEEYQSDFVSEGTASLGKMVNLKERVRKSGLEVFDGYPCHWGGKVNDVPLLFGLEKFGQRVLDNLWNSIQKHFLLPEVANPEALPMALQNSATEFSECFIGLESAVQAFSSLIDSTSTEIIMLTGKTGSGKSAFLVQVQRTILQTAFFICDLSQDPSLTDIPQVFRRLWKVVTSRLGLNIPVPKQDETVRSMFWQVMSVAAEKSRRGKIVLVFDGVDYLKSAQEVTLGWLPTDRNESLRIVLSCSEGSPVHRASTIRKDFEKNMSFFSLPTLSLAERKNLVSSILIQNGKTLSEDPFDNQMMNLVTKSDAGFPLYLLLACRELKQFGLFENLSQKVRSLPPNLSKLIQESLSNLEKYFGKDLLSTALCFIALAREGLAELELQMLLGAYLNSQLDGMDVPNIKELFLHFPPSHLMPPIQFAALARSLRDFLSGTTAVNRESRFKVPYLEIEKAIHSRFMGKLSQKKILGYHKILAGLFLSEADPNPSQPWQSKSPEAIKSIPHHLMASRNLPELSRTLCSLHFLYAAIRTSCAAALCRDVSKFLDSSHDSRASPDDTKDRLQKYLDFLKRNLFTPGMCYPLLIQQALCEPRSSVVFQDAMSLKKDLNVFVPAQDLTRDPCQRTITGFPSALLCTELDSVNGRLTIGVSDGTCLLLDECSGDLIHNFTGHSQAVCAVCFVGNHLLCTASLDGTLSLWNTLGGYRFSVLSGHSRRVSSCCSDSDGKTLVSAGWDHSIYIWNVRNATRHSSLDNKCPVNSVSHHPSEAIIVSGDWKGKVKLWNLQSLQRTAVFHGHQSSVTCTAFSTDGQFLASGSLTGEIILWSYSSGTQVSRPMKHLYAIRNLNFTGSSLISAATEGTLKVWTNHWGATNQVPSGCVKAIKILCNQFVILVQDEGTVSVCSLAGKVLYSEDIGDDVTCISGFYVKSFMHLEGIVIGTHSGHVKLSELGEPGVPAPFVEVDCYHKPVSCLATTRGRIYVGFNTGQLTFVNIKMGFSGPDGSADVKQVHQSKVTSVSILANKRILTTSHDMTFKLWSVDLQFGELSLIQAFHNSHNDWITCSAYAPDKQILVTGSQDTTLKVWNMKSFKEEHLLSGLGEPVSGIEILKNNIVCFGVSGGVGVWTVDGNLISILPSPHKSPIICDCSFQDDLEQQQQDGKTLDISGFIVTADSTSMFSLQPLFTLLLSQQLIGHTKAVTGCSSSNNNIVSTSLDHSLKWWTLESPESLTENSSNHPSHLGTKVTALDISKNGHRCLSADSGGTLVLWNLIENRLDYLCHVQHPSAVISAAVFVNESGTSFAYSVQTKDNIVLIFSAEQGSTVRKEKEWPLVQEVTGMEYSLKHDSVVWANRSGFVGIADTTNFSTYQIAKDWILGAKCHAEDKEKFYIGLVNGSVELVPTSFAAQTSGTGKTVLLPPSPNCFITSLEISETGDVFTGLSDGSMRVTRSAGVKRFQAHKDSITSVQLRGNDLFTASRDGTIKVWNRTNLTQVGQFLSNTFVTTMSVLSSWKPTKKVLFGTAAGNVQILVWSPKQK